ncbi:MAG: hypothetical protein F4Y86_19805, partial [Gammaproteobacteria bacterium]|nr:hypothetical protein [Gammaproteobacteria bacterium]
MAWALAAVAIGLPATAQEATIESARIVSTPSGGSATAPVWIIDDPVTVEVRYSAPLDPRASGSLDLELDEFGDGRGPKRTADCAVDGNSDSTLVCIYVVAEGDEGSGVSVEPRSGSLRGALLPRAVLPAAGVAASRADVDGIRVRIADGGVLVRILDDRGLDIGRKGAAAAGDTVEVTLEFAGREEPYAPGFSVALALDDGRRTMTYVEDGDGRPTFRYKVMAGDHDRRFQLALDGTEHLTDRNGNRGLAAGENVNEKYLAGSVRRVDAQGPRIEDIRVANSPLGVGAHTWPSVGRVQFVVRFDEAVFNAGAVTLDVLIGAGAAATSQSTEACAASGDELQCTLNVVPGWEDRDGIATPGNPLAFGEGALTDDLGNRAENRFVAKRFPNQRIDAVAPAIEAVVVKAGASPLRIGDAIDATVTFSEVVGRMSRPRPPIEMTLAGTEEINGVAEVDLEFLRRNGRALEFRYTLTESDANSLRKSDGSGQRIGAKYRPPSTYTVEDVHGNLPLTELPLPSFTSPRLHIAGESAGDDTTLPRIDAIILQNAPDNGRYRKCRDDEPLATEFECTVKFRVILSEPAKIKHMDLAVTIGSARALVWKRDSEVSKLIHDFSLKFGNNVNGNGMIAVSGLVPRAGLTRADRELLVDEGGYGYYLVRGEEMVGRDCLSQPTDPCSPGSLPRKSLTGAATVDTEGPTVESIAFLPTPAPRSVGAADMRKYYGEGETMAIEVAMSEKVKTYPERGIEGRGPRLFLTVGGSPGSLDRTIFRELRDGHKLVFEYTVQDGDEDRDGVSARYFSGLFADSVTDRSGNMMTFSANTIDASSAAHRVDGSLHAEDAE